MYLSGLHAIEEYLKRSGPKGELYISSKGKRAEAIRKIAVTKGLAVHTLTDREIAQRTGIDEHKGVILSVPDRAEGTGENLESIISVLTSDTALVILLDGITDPHNLGAVLRSAEQFGADCVILPRRKSAGLNDTVARTSAGAVEYVRSVTVPNLSRAVEYLKHNGFWVYGADADGETLYRSDFRGRVAIVLGSEGTGISRIVREHCDRMVSIPVSGRLDSLNVSVAAGIIMYEVRRQQGS